MIKERAKKFINIVKKAGLDGYLLASRADAAYLSGSLFKEKGDAVFLCAGKKIYCIALPFYEEPVGKNKKLWEGVFTRNLVSAALEIIKKLKLKNVGFDGGALSYDEGKILEGFARPVGGVSAALRVNKDAGELRAVRAACAAAYKAALYIRKNLKTGMTERQAARAIEKFMFNEGVGGLSFDTVAAFGSNGASEHHVPSDRKLKKDDAVLFDFGCKIDDYCSDITISWWHGKNEPDEYKKIWNIVSTAQKAALKKARPGMTGAEIDRISRDIIADAGYGKNFTHSLGHGVGLEIHEMPFVNGERGLEKIEAGAVLAVEPGIYLRGKYGVRLEETCVMTKTGLKILTK